MNDFHNHKNRKAPACKRLKSEKQLQLMVQGQTVKSPLTISDSNTALHSQSESGVLENKINTLFICSQSYKAVSNRLILYGLCMQRLKLRIADKRNLNYQQQQKLKELRITRNEERKEEGAFTKKDAKKNGETQRGRAQFCLFVRLCSLEITRTRAFFFILCWLYL